MRNHPFISGGANRAPETRLPLSLRSEVSQPGETQRDPKIDARPRSPAENPADAGHCRCGCGLVDVRGLLSNCFTEGAMIEEKQFRFNAKPLSRA